ncbi:MULTISPECIES: adenylyl-sulfate kinase [Paraburkholderia]|uniref:adenylyl-sulfate kinase n=1 Tax=Paraburkholderia TaxID=1822464 RepID=UPI00224D5F4F|nr:MULTISPECIES: adenylyl-sulfate kinase [Paraburkholderia]MCX4166257.1 adenylyl-sulfate kinase [Paraburkholderia megapolitana]MDN7161747.1 adenylyl-sulfate kinase [Paraburkholderia sp. CHISQ3]MDQ6498795.1 adenylyl-sulfate kinase [Paraburkholderia megapolitana]
MSRSAPYCHTPSAIAPVLWLTGVRGAGKSRIASGVQVRLVAFGAQAVVLDGDTIRSGLSEDLGYDPDAQTENIRRIAHCADLLSRQAVIPIVVAIAPLASHRRLAREIIGDAYFEIFVDTPPPGDPYSARSPHTQDDPGRVAQLADGFDRYERPGRPDLVVSRFDLSTIDAIETIMRRVPPVLWISEADEASSTGNATGLDLGRDPMRKLPLSN